MNTACFAMQPVRWTFFVLIVLFSTLFSFNSLTRIDSVGPDSMNYIDVAQNIANGKGIVQSTLGFNQPHFPKYSDVPTPLTIQAPLYPLSIAGLILSGIGKLEAAIIIALAGYVFLFAIAYRLTLLAYNEAAAVVAVAAMTIYAPLLSNAREPGTDVLGLPFLIAGLLVLMEEVKRGNIRLWVPFAAGCFFGAAFAVRYAMAPSLLVGLVGVGGHLWRLGYGWLSLALRLVVLSAGFFSFAGPILLRNFLITHRLMGEPGLSITLSPYAGLSSTFHALAGTYMEGIPAQAQEILFCSTVGFLLVIGRTVVRDAMLANARSLLTLAVMVFSAFFIYGRTRTFFDLNARVLLPVGTMLLVLGAGWATLVAGRHTAYLRYAAILAICFAIIREAYFAKRPPAPTFDQVVASSACLSWVETHTSDRDLIAGLHVTLSIPFYLERTGVLWYGGPPYTEYACYDTLHDWIRRHRSSYARFFFLMPRYNLSEAQWDAKYGSFIADLACRRLDSYPSIHLLDVLPDAVVYELYPES